FQMPPYAYCMSGVCAVLMAHQTTGYLSGQPVYFTHSGYIGSHIVVAVPWQPFLAKISSRAGAEPWLSWTGWAVGPMGFSVSCRPSTMIAATGWFMHFGPLRRSPPPTCGPMPRTTLGRAQPSRYVSQAPLL